MIRDRSKLFKVELLLWLGGLKAIDFKKLDEFILQAVHETMNKKEPSPNIHVLLVNSVLHLGHVIMIFPLCFGTRNFVLQFGHLIYL